MFRGPISNAKASLLTFCGHSCHRQSLAGDKRHCQHALNSVDQMPCSLQGVAALKAFVFRFRSGGDNHHECNHRPRPPCCQKAYKHGLWRRKQSYLRIWEAPGREEM